MRTINMLLPLDDQEKLLGKEKWNSSDQNNMFMMQDIYNSIF